ncbi:MAG: methionyl-tRNA formyltransferase [Candidatus Kerfeldbacteria bacterium]|nr:methionyl-tRNA formyltransferase [Candidatus Kerfeldbacteria bacterium]
MNKKPRAVFFGTPDFAVPILDALSQEAEVVGVVTQPDQPGGRGQTLLSSPVKRRAEQLNLRILTPPRLDQAVAQQVRQWEPAVAVLAAYGKILPPDVLRAPAKGFLNIHPSLLPKLRGPSPIAASILQGDRVTGVTLIVLDEQMDHGPIVAQQSFDIKPGEHRPSLESRLSGLGANLLRQSLRPYLDGRLHPQPQDHAHATYCQRLQKNDARIDWTLSAEEIWRRIRAFDPWPGAYTTFRGQPLKILNAEPRAESSAGRPGTVTELDSAPAIVCRQGRLVVHRLQLAGGRAVAISDFVRGHRDFTGSLLGA